MPDIGGIPAHPLIVHAAVAFIPLFAVLLIAYCVRPVWHRALRIPVIVTGILAAVPTFLAAGSGEDLEHAMKGKPGVNMEQIHEHAEAGDLLRIVTVALVVLTLIALFTVLKPWDHRRGERHPNRVLQMIVSAVLVLGAVSMVYQAVVTGHSGAKSVWSDSDKREQAS